MTIDHQIFGPGAISLSALYAGGSWHLVGGEGTAVPVNGELRALVQHGLGYAQAADTLAGLLLASRELGASGVVHKDEESPCRATDSAARRLRPTNPRL